MEKQLLAALQHGFMQADVNMPQAFIPKLINNLPGESLLSYLQAELSTATSFTFAVAFVTEGGLLMLKSQLADLAARGIRGRLLTSTYLNFNQPKVFRELLKLSNVDVRIVADGNFHTKAYQFNHDGYQTVIVGSANLTQTALKMNTEWNVRLSSLNQGDFAQQIDTQLINLWTNAEPLTPQWITTYAENYQTPSRPQVINTKQILPKPNAMQTAALLAIQAVRQRGADKALVVSATGTGKTYLGAFDVQQVKPQKMLFVAHREQLLKQALQTFRAVLGGPASDYGILSGSQHDMRAKYLFTTVQTMAQPATHEQFDPSEFEYILIDETHRAAAPSYQRLLAYFTPTFLLGLTATPERMDGFNVYELFDYNLAYEISLQVALKEDMLVPFHYIGVADYQQGDVTIDDATDLQHLVADERVNYLVAKTAYYGYAGEQLQGLIFVSRTEEGQVLAEKLTARGIPSMYLGGQTSQAEREMAIEQLTHGQLKYLISVDIFNEGIDIPSVNQVVMMRSTQSRIVFLQQLGRGLRKEPNKAYVTVLDFIGNYQQNYLIPQAFTAKATTDKDSLRMQLRVPEVTGVSTINFEHIAQERILAAVNSVKLDANRALQLSYQQLIHKFGRVPSLLEVYRDGTLDLNTVLTKFKTYPAFIAKMTKELAPAISAEFQQQLQFVSQELVLGKRPHELLVIQALLDNNMVTTLELMAVLSGVYQSPETLDSIARVLAIKDYYTALDRKKYGVAPLVNWTGDVWAFAHQLSPFEREYLSDAVQTGLAKITSEFNLQQQFTMYQRYSRKDVLRLLNWQHDLPSLDIGGYKYDEATNTLPIFITIDKSEQQAADIAYENTFINRQTIPFFSKPQRTLQSNVEARLYDADKHHVQVEVFVKKSDDEGKLFYYLGPALANQNTSIEVQLFNERKQVQQNFVRFELLLEHEVPFDLYQALSE
ncbi:DUF3427 domain-containing protein [Periweissella cryptocerci]|uniref:DUF3427 domain-containing protein n=1 Tax=Periweissella cryptocerci TaxID=2506420 RepID=A0A4P6YV23_9LACO|nr:DEAD/DEAH box helicase [Periweissella cryptocerci]QBO36586.1 DUF3427 domain-containing protein [Periweissella cryptocerci]